MRITGILHWHLDAQNLLVLGVEARLRVINALASTSRANVSAVDIRTGLGEDLVQDDATEVLLVTTLPATIGQAQVVVIASLLSGELLVGTANDATALDNAADGIDGSSAGSTDNSLILNARHDLVAHAEALEENLEGADTAISGDLGPADVSQVAARSLEVAGGLEAEVELEEDDIVPDDHSAEGLLDDSALTEAGEHEVLDEVDRVSKEAQRMNTALGILSDNGMNEILEVRVASLEGSEVLATLINHGSTVQADGTIEGAGVVGEESGVFATQTTELVAGAIVVIVIIIIAIAMTATMTTTAVDCCLVGVGLGVVFSGVRVLGNLVHMVCPLLVGERSLARSENDLLDEGVVDGVDDRESGNS
jgi:hypothetical protein